MIETQTISEVTNEDCMDFMARYPDKYFDLACVDPDYGIGENWKKDKSSQFYKHTSTYKNKSIPSEQYFSELFRVSKQQVIWGGNYYTKHLPPRNSWIVWDKKRDYPTQHLSEGELAWTSFNIPLRIAEFLWNGCCVIEPRAGSHPHEKPIRLYDWIYLDYLRDYIKHGMKVIDTHLGGGSNRIAAHKAGLDFWACELDKEYFDAQEKRFKDYVSQLRLF